MSRIALDDLFRRAIDVVEGQRIPYLLYGGLAFPFWGRAATTDDVDLVVQVTEESAVPLLQAFRSAGFQIPFSMDSLFLIDTWATASLEGRDVDLAVGTTEFDRSALERAVRKTLFQREVPIATAEDLILYKLVSFRHRDLGHVQDILRRQAGHLDLPYLRDWASRIATATGKFEISPTLERMLKESQTS